MDAVISAARSISFAAIVFILIGYISPTEQSKKLIRPIFGSLVAVMLVSAFQNSGEDIGISDEIEYHRDTRSNVVDSSRRYLEEQAENNLSAALMSILAENGITDVEISADVNICENDSIYLTEVRAETNAGSTDEVREIIINAVGRETAVFVTAKGR
ncbi:MAG: hypothetical protein II773_07860 [Oscillospiraceae bacterium]|nr:hypothetical protein [Oscillospiraceae bacterium]